MRDVVFVALGSNVGDRAAYLACARNALSLIEGTRVLGASRVEETAPLGGVAQGPYLNQMVAIETPLSPLALLGHLHDIERRLGRVRSTQWTARTIDLDIVRFGVRRVASMVLALPHPGIGSRDFWRRELAELSHLLGAA